MKMSIASRSRQASIAAEPVSPEVAPTMVTRSPRFASTWSNSRPEQLQRHVLEGQRGPVEQLHQPGAVIELLQRRHGRVAEAGIGVADQAGELRLARSARRETAVMTFTARSTYESPRISPQFVMRECRPGFGHIQPAVAGQTGQKTSSKASVGAAPRVLM